MNNCFFLLLFLTILILGGCSENTNNSNVISGLSSSEEGISSSEQDIGLSSFENIESSSTEIPGMSSSEEIGLSSSSENEPESSSSSGMDYSNWVLKKSISWSCDDALCNTKTKSSEINYDYSSYTDAEHYTQNEHRVSSSYTWTYTTTRNGLNYSGTQTTTQYVPNTLTLSSKREITFTEERHPIANTYIHREEVGQKITYTNGEVSKSEPVNLVLTNEFLDLGDNEGLNCYKYTPGNIANWYDIKCYDENNIWRTQDVYSNNVLTGKNTNRDVIFFNPEIWTSFIEYSSLTNGIWQSSNAEIVIVTKTDNLIVVYVKQYDASSALTMITERHYGPVN